MGRDMAADRAPSKDAESVEISASAPPIEVLFVATQLHSAPPLVTPSSWVPTASVLPLSSGCGHAGGHRAADIRRRSHGATHAPHVRASRGESRGSSLLQLLQPSSGIRALQPRIDKSLTYRDVSHATGAEHGSSHCKRGLERCWSGVQEDVEPRERRLQAVAAIRHPA